MELFHEYKNKYFHLVLKILNLCKNGLCREKILEVIKEYDYEEKLISKDSKTFEGMILNQYDKDNLNLLKQVDEKYYCVLNNENNNIPIKIRFSNIEKTWLKGMLAEKNVQALLGDEIVEKLNYSLKDIDEGSNEVIEFTNKNINQFEDDMNKITKIIFTILNAIDKQKVIIYTNVDRRGNEHKNIRAIPLRIEYSLKDDTFRASMYSVEEQRSIMVNLYNLKEINVTDENFILDRKELISSIKKNKFCEIPITILLRDRRGAMERFFMGFSSFERSSKLIDEDTYEVDIYYYIFQEEEVISKLISLGPYVIVKGPERIKKIVIEKIKKAYDYQCQ